MTNTDTPENGIGISEAADAFADILDGKSDNRDAKGNDADETSADDAEALEAASEDETPSDEEGAEDDDADADGEEAEDGTDQMEMLVTVKIDGKEEQIPLKEAIAGYQRQADYSRKTAAISEMRRAVQSEAQQVMAERAQYAQLLTSLQQQLVQTVQQEPDWDKLYAEDPLEYVRQKDLHRERQERLTAATVEQQRVMALMQEQQANQLQEVVKVGRERLAEVIPAWQNQERWEQDRVKLRKYATETLGYGEQEISQVYDPRAVIALHKAMRYDELMARKPSPDMQTGPRPMRPGAAQTMPTRRTSEITKAKQRLAKTGRVRDAAAVFESLL